MSNKLVNIQEPTGNTERPQSNIRTLNDIFEHPFLNLPFRAFFLLAPAFAIISLSAWLAFLNGIYQFFFK